MRLVYLALMRRFALLLLTASAVGCAVGCASESEEVGEDENAITVEGEYAFKYEFPANQLFARPFTKAFTSRIENRGITMDATITPTVKLEVGSPVVEGKVTVGRRGFIIKKPKIIDAEAKVSSTYLAKLDVDLDVRFSDTRYPNVMRELSRELEEQLNGGKELELATHLGEQTIPIRDLGGRLRTDLPLKAYYDVAVTCSFDEIDGNIQGHFQSGIRGTVVGRAIYNIDGVERRRFARDPTKKFLLDTNDFKVEPAPSFRYNGPRRHIKGTCAVQPSVVVSFDNGVGVSVRVDAESSFDTVLAARNGEEEEWQLIAKPRLSIWGETDILLPIIHRNWNIEKQLWARDFPEVRVAVNETPAEAPPATPPADGCFSATLQKTMPELSCVQSNTTQLWYQCNDGKWFRGGDATEGPYGPCSSSHPL
jgi:hypothetical protein